MVKVSLDEMQCGTLERCLGVIEEFEIGDGEYLPMRLAKTFVYVALFEGSDIGEMRELTGEIESTVSRQLRRLGNGTKRSGGLQLIQPRHSATYIDIYNRTSKGRKMAKGIIAAFEKS